MSYKHDALEQEKRELIEALIRELKWTIPIQMVMLAAVYFLAADFFPEPLSAPNIITVAVTLFLQNALLPLYRLWRINKRLATSRSKAKQPRFLN